MGNLSYQKAYKIDVIPTEELLTMYMAVCTQSDKCFVKQHVTRNFKSKGKRESMKTIRILHYDNPFQTQLSLLTRTKLHSIFEY
jgi:hypothetical protein